MASPRRFVLVIIAGTLVFGLLTFLLGLVIGANLAHDPPAPASAKAPAPPAKPALPQPAIPKPGAATSSSSAAPTAAPAAPAAAKDAPAQPGAGAAPVPAKGAAAAPEPSLKPMKVKGFGYGLPPFMAPPAPVTLATSAAAAKPDDAKAAPPAAPPDKAPPLLYSAAIGRFLSPANAGRLVQAAQAKGYTPMLVEPAAADATPWLTVTLGPVTDLASARALVTEAATDGFDARFVSWLKP